MPASSSVILVQTAVTAISVLSLLSGSAAAQQKEGSGLTTTAQVPANAKVAVNYGQIPLSFEINRGQTEPSVQFLSRGRGYTLFLRQGDVVLALRSAKPAPAGSASPADSRRFAMPAQGEIETSFVCMRLVGANLHAAVREEDQQITRTNYFIGNHPAKWRTDVPNFGRVRYSGIYDGIDLVYYGNQSRLEHDFIVAPGADPARIRLALNGAKQMRIDPVTGDLVLHAGNGELRLLKPITYQESNGQRTRVLSSYKLLAKNQIGFQVASYNHAQPLVVDPVLVYSTYLGGSGNSSGQGDQGNGIAVDSAGNAYIVGTTYSVDFPTTNGAFQLKNRSALAKAGGTVFVSKLNPAGTALVYSTYLGGSGGDFGYAIALDSTDHAYITGATFSRDFPLTCGAFRRSNVAEAQSGGTTVFIAKLLVAGDRLAYSTFLGGTGNHATPGLGDVAQAIAVDAAGDAYVAGYTYSADFPRTHDTFQTQFKGTATAPNAFVAKMSPQGSAEIYSTLLGGEGGDFANAIAIDAKGDAFVAGSTGSANFPVTDGAFQTVSHGSTSFVTELNPKGTDAIYSTFLGGSGGDSAQAIAVDSKGFTYVAGTTSSGDFPVTSGSLENPNSGIGAVLPWAGSTGFAAKISVDGSALEYSSYIEGFGTTIAGLAVDSTGAAYMAGKTSPQGDGNGYGGFQATPDAVIAPDSGGHSAFLVKLDPSATVLNYATLLGGSESDGATALALDDAGSVYLTGFADSADFPVSSGAYQTSSKASAGAAGNAFVSKFALASEGNQTSYPSIGLFPTTTTTSCGIYVDTCDDGTGFGRYDVCFTGSMTPNIANGPTPTGALEVDWDSGFADVYQAPYSISRCGTFLTSSWPVTETCSAGYSGDALYAGSSDSASDTEGQDCPQPVQPDARKPWRDHIPKSQLPVRLPFGGESQRLAFHSASSKVQNPGPKFIPPPEIHPATPIEPQDEAVDREAATVQCRSPLLPLTVTVHSASRRYGAANPKFTFEVSGAVAGSPVTATVTSTTVATAESPAGNYRIFSSVALSGTGQKNYEVIVNEGTLTVTPAPLTVTVHSATTSYGAGIPNVDFAVTGLINGDTITVTPLSTATAASPVGSYPLSATVSGSAAPNYAVKIISSTLTITKAPLTVTPGGNSRPYGSPNLIGPDSINFDNNFSASLLLLNGSAKVESQVLNLISNSKFGSGSAYYLYKAATTKFRSDFTVQFSSNQPEGITFILQNQGDQALGEPGGALGYGSPFYDGGIGESIAVKFQLYSQYGQSENMTGFYTGGAYPSTNESDMSGSGINLHGGDIFEVQLDYNDQSQTLTETVTDTVTHAAFTQTYASVNLPGLVCIPPNSVCSSNTAIAGFTASSAQGIADGAYANVLSWKFSSPQPPLSGFSMCCFVNGETQAVVAGEPVFTTTAKTTSPVGNYPIDIAMGTLSAANYSFALVPGNLKVTHAPIAVTPNSFTIKQGQPVPTLTYTMTGFVLDQTRSIVSGKPYLHTTATSSSPPGIYQITGNSGTLKAPNYSFQLQNGAHITIQK